MPWPYGNRSSTPSPLPLDRASLPAQRGYVLQSGRAKHVLVQVNWMVEELGHDSEHVEGEGWVG